MYRTLLRPSSIRRYTTSGLPEQKDMTTTYAVIGGLAVIGAWMYYTRDVSPARKAEEIMVKGKEDAKKA